MSHLFKSVGKAQLLSKRVEEEIEEAIRTRKLTPGTRLPSELELCEQFGVSRTAMREALRVLSARGLIRIEKGRGMFVNEVSADTVANPMELYLFMNYGQEDSLHVIHARQLIEPHIAEQAALHHTERDAERLRKDIEDLKACTGSMEELSDLDMSFHMHIAKACGNPIVPLLLDPIHRMMPRIKATVYAAIGDAKDAAVEWHGNILDAILEGDPEKARDCMSKHLEIAEEHVQTAVAKLKDNGQAPDS